jgi:pimeloyl-ACP methyl ester carboxylesterase
VLNSPVTVTIPFDPAALSAGKGIVLPNFLGVFFLDPHTGQKVFQDTFRVDTVQNVLVGTLDHFSAYVTVIMRRLCPPPTGGVLCPTTYTDVSSYYLPALFVHGHVFAGLSFDALRGFADETTWGDLPTLLGIPPPSLFPFISDQQDRIGAWRFDYDSRDVSFRTNAYALADAIAHIKTVTHRPAVNIVAHSFGGILARTYLQGMASADGTGNPAGPRLAYQKNVNKLLTLGTPHRGIGSVLFGDDFSRFEADACALKSTETHLPTCFEAATALRNTLQGIWQDKGALLDALNSNSPPHDLPREKR